MRNFRTLLVGMVSGMLAGVGFGVIATIYLAFVDESGRMIGAFFYLGLLGGLFGLRVGFLVSLLVVVLGHILCWRTLLCIPLAAMAGGILAMLLVYAETPPERWVNSMTLKWSCAIGLAASAAASAAFVYDPQKSSC